MKEARPQRGSFAFYAIFFKGKKCNFCFQVLVYNELAHRFEGALCKELRAPWGTMGDTSNMIEWSKPATASSNDWSPFSAASPVVITKDRHHFDKPSVTQYHWFVFEENKQENNKLSVTPQVNVSKQKQNQKEKEYWTKEQKKEYFHGKHGALSNVRESATYGAIQIQDYNSMTTPTLLTIPIIPSVPPLTEGDSYLPIRDSNSKGYGYGYGYADYEPDHGWPSPQKENWLWDSFLCLLGPMLFLSLFGLALMCLIIPTIPLLVWTTSTVLTTTTTPSPTTKSSDIIIDNPEPVMLTDFPTFPPIDFAPFSPLQPFPTLPPFPSLFNLTLFDPFVTPSTQITTTSKKITKTTTPTTRRPSASTPTTLRPDDISFSNSSSSNSSSSTIFTRATSEMPPERTEMTTLSIPETTTQFDRIPEFPFQPANIPVSPKKPNTPPITKIITKQPPTKLPTTVSSTAFVMMNFTESFFNFTENTQVVLDFVTDMPQEQDSQVITLRLPLANHKKNKFTPVSHPHRGGDENNLLFPQISVSNFPLLFLNNTYDNLHEDRRKIANIV